MGYQRSFVRIFISAPDLTCKAEIRQSGSCGPLHGEHWWPCGRSWCSCGSESHELPCADASWAEKFFSWFVSSVKTYPRYGVWCGPRVGTGLQFNSISHSMAFCQAFFSLSRKLFANFFVKRFSTFSPFCRGKLVCHKILWPRFHPATTPAGSLFLCIINYIIEIWTHSVFCGILT